MIASTFLPLNLLEQLPAAPLGSNANLAEKLTLGSERPTVFSPQLWQIFRGIPPRVVTGMSQNTYTG